MLRHIHNPPPRPSALDPSLPPVFDELIARLLAKDAAERPASAEEVRSWVARIRNPVPTAKVRPPRTQATVEGRRLSVPAPPTPRGEERPVRVAFTGTVARDDKASDTAAFLTQLFAKEVTRSGREWVGTSELTGTGVFPDALRGCPSPECAEAAASARADYVLLAAVSRLGRRFAVEL
jgi:serine/threonine protein kinase